MYCVITYDINAVRNRKMLSLLRQYLYHAQKSVFEGELTNAQLKQLLSQVEQIMHKNSSDVLTVYTALIPSQIQKTELVSSSDEKNII